MRRLVPLILVLAALPTATAHARTIPLAARLTACTTGATADERTAAFTASMPAVPESRRMAVRFDLRERVPPGDAFAAVRVPGLGVWHRSRARRPGFVFTQRVESLAAPGAYLAHVRFRWYDARGRIVRTARRDTRICRQPDERPDLTVASLTALPGPMAGSLRYTVVIANEGRGDAGPFDVVVTPNSTPQPAQRLGGLAAGEETSVTVIGPRCDPGSTLRIVVDADAEIAERDEVDNVADRVCPLRLRR